MHCSKVGRHLDDCYVKGQWVGAKREDNEVATKGSQTTSRFRNQRRLFLIRERCRSHVALNLRAISSITPVPIQASPHFKHLVSDVPSSSQPLSNLLIGTDKNCWIVSRPTLDRSTDCNLKPLYSFYSPVHHFRLLQLVIGCQCQCVTVTSIYF